MTAKLIDLTVNITITRIIACLVRLKIVTANFVERVEGVEGQKKRHWSPLTLL